MTLEQLQQLIGCRVFWLVPVRAKGNPIKLQSTIVAVRQTCGRPELLIQPDAAEGQTWVRLERTTLIPCAP